MSFTVFNGFARNNRRFRIWRETNFFGDNLPPLVINNNTGTITKYFLYSGQPLTFDISKYTYIAITMVAGGGAGGRKNQILSTNYSGGGGGAGGSIINFPIFVKDNNYKSITLYVGKGGKAEGQNGEDTYVELDGVTYTMFGGKAAKMQVGGEGGFGNVLGAKGLDGSVSLPSLPVTAGAAGGDAFIGYGGGSQSISSKVALPPVQSYGGGGKGMDLDSDVINPGSDGIIMVTVTI